MSPTAARPAYPLSAVVGQDDLRLALVLAAVDPSIGGVLLRGQKGSAKSTAARGLARLLPGPAPFVELPVGASEDRVTGTVDLRALLQSGDSHFSPGLLAAAHGGVLYVDEVNLLPDHVVDVLLDVAASGVNRVEREGVSHEHPSRFILLGSMNPEEGELRPQFLDRFGLAVDVTAPVEPAERAEAVRRRLAFDADPTGFTDRWSAAEAALAERLANARPAPMGEELVEQVARLCVAAGAEGLRADLVCCRAAAALAGWEGKATAGEVDVRRVAAFALGHRRRRSPFELPGLADEELQHALDEAFAPAGRSEAARGLGDQAEGCGGLGDGAEGGGASGSAGQTMSGGASGDGGRGESGGRRESGAQAETGGPSSGGGSEIGGQAGSGSQRRSSSRFGGGGGGDGAGRFGTDDGAGGRSPGDGGTGTGAQAIGEGPSGDEHDGLEKAVGQTAAQVPPPSVGLASGVLDTDVAQRPRGTPNGTAAGRRAPAPASRGRRVGAAVPDGAVREVATAASVRAAAGRGATSVAEQDVREAVLQHRVGQLVVLAVDASGSMGAERRLHAATGAAVTLLLDAYQRRDRVALVTFRGNDASVVLAPTGSVEVARARLVDLATGGRTPLAAGIGTALDVARSANRSGHRPVIVVVSDGRATAGPGGRDPVEAALHAADQVRRSGVAAVVVDAEDGPTRLGLAGTLAAAMGARLVPAAELSGDAIAEAVRQGS